MSVAISLHILSAVIWVGGMFFAYIALRPAAASLLETPQRLLLWQQTLKRFFLWVWTAIILLLLTGYWMMFSHFGGWRAPVFIHIMQTLGIVMILIYLHVFFAPYRRLRKAIKDENWPQGGEQLAQIRKFVAINLSLGLIVVIVAAAGRYF